VIFIKKNYFSHFLHALELAQISYKPLLFINFLETYEIKFKPMYSFAKKRRRIICGN